MEPLAALLAIIGLFVLFAFVLTRVDGVALFAPRSTRGIELSAGRFCTDQCRVEGECPVTRTTERWADCPLWKYVAADVPTVIYGSPFEQQAGAA